MRAAVGKMRCTGTNQRGLPCGGYKVHGTEFCVLHGPVPRGIIEDCLSDDSADNRLHRRRVQEPQDDWPMTSGGLTLCGKWSSANIGPSYDPRLRLCFICFVGKRTRRI